jgi:hypothetical protein
MGGVGLPELEADEFGSGELGVIVALLAVQQTQLAYAHSL